MLSNASSAIAKRRQSHRRQNSTPVAFEAPNIRPIPATIQNQRTPGNGHRRGMSLDQRPTFQGGLSNNTATTQDDMSVSITTNPGQQHPQHPIQQEAQQQRSAQPGQQAAHQQSLFQQIQQQPRTPQPLTEPQDGSFEQADLQFSQQLAPSRQASPAVGSPHSRPAFEPGKSPGPSDEAVQNLKQHIEAVYGAYGATIQVNILPSPVAAPQKAGSDNLDIAPLTSNLNDMTAISLDPPTGGFSMTPLPSSDPSSYSPPAYNRSPSSSPRRPHLDSFLADVEEIPSQNSMSHLGFSDAAPLLSSPMMHQGSNSSFFSSSPMHSPGRSPRAMSIADLNLDGSIEETGISAEEIATYISQQDSGGRWTCLFPGCNKDFGRRENIRSHVQTHLGDRQFRCNHCNKCFVRQHDLKRHAKIHSGDKPYRCACGGGFARQDALTRHRQRGMCVGRFPGAVRSTARRGRPRKNNRPDMDDRVDKANRTRRNVVRRNYADSPSGESISDDSVSSPIAMEDFNCFDSAPLAEFSSEPSSDPFHMNNASSPIPSTPPTHVGYDNVSSPLARKASPAKSSAAASPFDFDTQAGAQDPSAYDLERERADVDALFDFNSVAAVSTTTTIAATKAAAQRFQQTPPHSPVAKVPGSGSSRGTQDLPPSLSNPKSPSRHSANSAASTLSAAFTTPPTSPITGTVVVPDGASGGSAPDAFCDFSASTSGYEMSGISSTSLDMGVSMFDLSENSYGSQAMIDASMSWIDSHF